MKVQIGKQFSSFMDFVRGGSAIVVLLVHVYFVFISPHYDRKAVAHIMELSGSYAVMIFFIISGFMITSSVLRNIDVNAGRFDGRKYLLDRLVRLYPALLFSLLLTIGVFYLITGFRLHGSESFIIDGDFWLIRERVTLEWDRLFISSVYLQEIVPAWYAPNLNGSLWSLGYEFWFYILAFTFVNGLINKRVVTGWLLSALIIFSLILLNNNSFFTYLLIWCAGMFWALLYHRRETWSRDVKPALLILAVFIVLLLITIGTKNDFSIFLRPKLTVIGRIAQSLISWLIMLLGLWISLMLDGRKLKLGSLPYSAKFSYTLYAIHFPLLLLGFSLLHPWLHSLNWKFSMLFGLLMGLLILLISATLARKVENKELVRKLFRRHRIPGNIKSSPGEG